MTDLHSIVYLLCMLASLVCLVLLARGYRRSRVKLLMWSAWCFVGLAFNNFFLFLDVVVFPDVNLMPYRYISTCGALAVLLYGLIWEMD
jgi:hypothetical protein